jgi:long-chain fatty acid transport protein
MMIKEETMKKILTFCALGLLVLGAAPAARASGFLIYEHGAAAMGVAGAFVGVANDATAVFHNPAGLAFLEGTQISLGGTVILPTGSLSLPNWPYADYQKVDMVDQTFFAPNVYLTHRVSDKVAVGIGVFAPFGLGTKWPKDYPLRYIGVSNEMQTVIVNPTIAYRVSDDVGIGFGVCYVHSTLTLDLVQRVSFGPYGSYDIPASVDKAKGDHLAWNFGLLYKKNKFSAGLNYRSGFPIKYEGDLKLDPVNVPTPLKGYIPATSKVWTTFSFPSIIGLGVGYQFTPKLLGSVDLHYIGWSVYDQYKINIDYPDPLPDPEPETVEENFKDSVILRGGLDYKVSEALSLRGGVLYDWTPQPEESVDPNLPDANRIALILGAGYSFGKFRVDVGFQHEMFSDRTSPNRDVYLLPNGMNLGEGTYSTTANLIGFNLSYRF